MDMLKDSIQCELDGTTFRAPNRIQGSAVSAAALPNAVVDQPRSPSDERGDLLRIRTIDGIPICTACPPNVGIHAWNISGNPTVQEGLSGAMAVVKDRGVDLTLAHDAQGHLVPRAIGEKVFRIQQDHLIKTALFGSPDSEGKYVGQGGRKFHHTPLIC